MHNGIFVWRWGLSRAGVILGVYCIMLVGMYCTYLEVCAGNLIGDARMDFQSRQYPSFYTNCLPIV